ncbi:hypothetical protein QPK14_21465 [Photorhabdus temperata subsp. temperata]|uniref:Uncharacterized protein n=2 Tax=Photorhabdus TaxID=29487 RepID=A0A7X5QI78_9GAMM|nr:hypothetical protein [Photorhabdus cinerea]KER03379.1 hypothetical protein MEG1DRAFT_01854 [Photorhabdus temperata subsp. temperata Meg1]NHB94844.1 hypothetical protein [Photorhabdus cinerea]
MNKTKVANIKKSRLPELSVRNRTDKRTSPYQVVVLDSDGDELFTHISNGRYEYDDMLPAILCEAALAAHNPNLIVIDQGVEFQQPSRL